ELTSIELTQVAFSGKASLWVQKGHLFALIHAFYSLQKSTASASRSSTHGVHRRLARSAEKAPLQQVCPTTPPTKPRRSADISQYLTSLRTFLRRSPLKTTRLLPRPILLPFKTLPYAIQPRPGRHPAQYAT